MKDKWLLILIIFVFILAINNANADWRDKLDNFKSKVKNTTKRVQSGTQKAKKNWKHMKEKSKEFGKKIKTKVSNAKNNWDEGHDKRKEIYNSVKKQYRRNLDKIRDPETRRKATKTISTIAEIRQKIRDTKKKGVNAGFDTLAKIPIHGTTLGELASKKLYRKFPELRRTGLFDNPAEAATALVCHDSGFFLNEVPLIQKNGRNISVYGAIRESSSFDASKTIKYLQIAGATESITSANNVGDAMISVFGAIDAANR